MPRKHDKEKNKNIEVSARIRDGENSRPIAVIQAVRAINKLLPKGEPDSSGEFDKNVTALVAIRDDEGIEDTLRIMAINTLNTMLDNGETATDNRPTETEIMARIRGAKK